MLEIPPCCIVVPGRDLPRKNSPAPAVDGECERQERDFVERDAQQHRRVTGGAGQAVEQSDAAQVFRRHRERDRVTDRFVKAVVGAALKEIRLRLVRALIEVVAQLVMDRDEVLACHLDAHLDPDVVLRVQIPGARMTDHVAIARLGELRALPEGPGQRIEAERGVEALAVAHHPPLVDAVRAEQRGEVHAGRGRRRRDHVVNIAPLLRPDIAEQMGGDHTAAAHELGITVGQTRAYVRVQLEIKRLELLPEPVDFLHERVGRHVVPRAPHHADVGKAESLRARVREGHEARVAVPHAGRDAVPSLPRVEQLGRIAARRQDVLDVGDLEAVVRGLAVGTAAVVGLHTGRDSGELGRLAGVGRRRRGEGQLQQQELAPQITGQAQSLVATRLHSEVARSDRVGFLGFGRQRFGIERDEGVGDPVGARRLHVQVVECGLRMGEETSGAGDSRRLRVEGGRQEHQHEKPTHGSTITCPTNLCFSPYRIPTRCLPPHRVTHDQREVA